MLNQEPKFNPIPPSSGESESLLGESPRVGVFPAKK
jgi:hypothetical protein